MIPPPAQESLFDELKIVPLDEIQVNPYQPRKEFSKSELEELSLSIQSVGLLHPPLVRALPQEEGNKIHYEIISGERRFRAAKLAGLKAIAVYIRKASAFLSAQAALIENIQRVDLNPLEVAHALKRLMIEFGLTQELLAKQLGKKRSTLANYLRLLTLPAIIQQAIAKEEISMGHAKAILSLEGESKQRLLYEKIIAEDMNVREAEKTAQKIEEKAKKQKLGYLSRNFYLEQLAEKMREKLGTKVSIQGKDRKGKIQIDYYSLDDLDRLLHLLGIIIE